VSAIAIFGGTGYAGGHIAAEATKRGHHVTSYSRSLPEKGLPGVTYVIGSLADAETVATAAAGNDVVVLAVRGLDVDGEPLVDRLPMIIGAVAGHARLGVVGGASSSLVTPGGHRLLDTPDFHEEWKPEATSHAAVLAALQADRSELDWFYVSPAALFGAFFPGEDTGHYRTGDDLLVIKDDGSSEISGTDFARAFVDEIDTPRHHNRRFTVGH